MQTTMHNRDNTPARNEGNFCENTGYKSCRRTPDNGLETDVLVIQSEVRCLLHSGRPQVVTHALRVGIVMVRLRAVGAADVVVLVVHAVLGVTVLWLRVHVTVVCCSRRWQGLLRG